MESMHQKPWVISVNMGYGHGRAAYGLEDLAFEGIITANHYPGIPERDQRLWNSTRRLYEIVSRLQPIPVLGPAVFGIMDYFQRIPSFYPRRDLSKTTIQLNEMYHLIEHEGLGKHLIDKLAARDHRPLISTFFVPAFAAEVHGYPGDIYCVCCDADVSRAWAPRDPKRSRIRYIAPNGRVVERLKLYGVKENQIFLTGFPLPKQNIGGPESIIVKKDLAARIARLDPNRIFIEKYHETLQEDFGADWEIINRECRKCPVTVTFSVGGAGAQQNIGQELLWSLRKPLLRNQIRLNLEVGTRKPLAHFYHQEIRRLGLQSAVGKTLAIHYYDDRPGYFRGIAHTLRSTDVLWTKPSELSFYTGLGLPIIIAPPIGSQEEFNKMWLMTVGGGIPQFEPAYADEWLFDWIDSGGLARFAWNGFIEAPTHGTYRIESILTGEKVPLATLPLVV